jgi:hypothetical protein
MSVVLGSLLDHNDLVSGRDPGILLFTLTLHETVSGKLDASFIITCLILGAYMFKITGPMARTLHCTVEIIYVGSGYTALNRMALGHMLCVTGQTVGECTITCKSWYFFLSLSSFVI